LTASGALGYVPALILNQLIRIRHCCNCWASRGAAKGEQGYMHQSAMKHGKLFFDTYLSSGWKGGDLSPLEGERGRGRILDIGSLDVNGSLRQVAPAHFDYVGVDFESGNGVDVILEDPYHLPFGDGTFDACISSSCFEHSEFFWLVFDEVMRILRPDGLFYLNAPSNGPFHRYPMDCWRFYPDSGHALVNWARRSGRRPAMLETFIGSRERREPWYDFVAVFVQDEAFAERHPRRMIDTLGRFFNGMRLGSDDVIRYSLLMEDRTVRSFLRRLERDLRMKRKERKKR